MSKSSKFLVFVMSICLVGIGMSATKPTGSQLGLKSDKSLLPAWSALLRSSLENEVRPFRENAYNIKFRIFDIISGPAAVEGAEGLELLLSNERFCASEMKDDTNLPFWCEKRSMMLVDQIRFNVIGPEGIVASYAEDFMTLFQKQIKQGPFQKVRLMTSKGQVAYSVYFTMYLVL